MSATDCLIKISNLSFSRGNRQILDNVSFEVSKNKITAILGPSGTGKTTILKLICGQLMPDSGSVEILGQNVNDISKSQLYQLRREIGVLFQSGALLNNLSVYDNVAFPLREHTALSEEMIRYLVVSKLKAVGLQGVGHLQTRELSGGMARRAALARAIALDPRIMFFDEPFAGQDPILMGVLLGLIEKLTQAFNLTSIVITHDIEEIFKIADHVFVLNEGHLVAQGTPTDIRNHESQFIRQFLKIQKPDEGIDVQTDDQPNGLVSNSVRDAYIQELFPS